MFKPQPPAMLLSFRVRPEGRFEYHRYRLYRPAEQADSRKTRLIRILEHVCWRLQPACARAATRSGACHASAIRDNAFCDGVWLAGGEMVVGQALAASRMADGRRQRIGW